MDDIRAMKKEDQIVLVNLERMRAALAAKNNVKWDLEKVHLESQNKLIKDETIIMKNELKRIREQSKMKDDIMFERA